MATDALAAATIRDHAALRLGAVWADH